MRASLIFTAGTSIFYNFSACPSFSKVGLNGILSMLCVLAHYHMKNHILLYQVDNTIFEESSWHFSLRIFHLINCTHNCYILNEDTPKFCMLAY